MKFRIFLDDPVREALAAQIGREVMARPVVSVSVSFNPPPAPRSTRSVIDDLGVPADRRRQNEGRRFWSNGAVR